MRRKVPAPILVQVRFQVEYKNGETTVRQRCPTLPMAKEFAYQIVTDAATRSPKAHTSKRFENQSFR